MLAFLQPCNEPDHRQECLCHLGPPSSERFRVNHDDRDESENHGDGAQHSDGATAAITDAGERGQPEPADEFDNEPTRPTDAKFCLETEATDEHQQAGDAGDDHHLFSRFRRSCERVEGIAEKNEDGSDVENIIEEWTHGGSWPDQRQFARGSILLRHKKAGPEEPALHLKWDNTPPVPCAQRLKTIFC